MITALTSNHRSNVLVGAERRGHRDHTVLDEQILLASEGDENASRGFSINLADQRRLAGTDRSLLLGAVSAPVHQHLVSVGNGIELSGKSKPCPNSDGLIERLRKHVILLCSLNAKSGVSRSAGASLNHPRLGRGFIFKNALAQRKAAKGVAGHFHGLNPVTGHDARSKRRFVDRVAFLIRPVHQKLDRILQIGDLPHERAILQIDRFREGFASHLILSFVERFQQLSRHHRAAGNYLGATGSKFKMPVVSESLRLFLCLSVLSVSGIAGLAWSVAR